MTRYLIVLAVAHAAASTAGAQAPVFAVRTPASAYVLSRNVMYGSSGDHGLAMDVYRPTGNASERHPVLIMWNRGMGAEQRSVSFVTGWAQAAAARGVTTIIPDLRPDSEPADFTRVVRYAVSHGAELGVDPERVAVYAASGNVSTAFPVLEDPATAGVRAAVIYYGAAPIEHFRLDLPVLYVRAGLDRPPVNAAITQLASLAASQNAPVTLLNHPTGYHGFEVRNDDDASRDIIERTIDFVKRSTAPGFQAALRGGLLEAKAAGYVATGKSHEAAAIYADLVRSRPGDPTLGLAYAEALLGDRQFAAACAEFDKLRDKPLGWRDRGLPAASACLQKGDADAAIAWLKTIPSRFLPAGVQDDPVFAPLKSRADFRALFQPQPPG
jgi:dienelactone hydrolase